MAEEQKAMPNSIEEQVVPIYGDILDAILSHVMLIDLVPASHVSRAWESAVSSCLSHLNPIKPWLMVYTQNRPTNATKIHAYDPRSNVWIEVSQPSMKHVSTLRSLQSNFLYKLSPSNLSFSFDTLHLDWHDAGAPLVWRIDPIVALVGHIVVVAGGASDFEDDPLAVETYDLKTRKWERCPSMPEIFKDSSASTWLSTAVDDRMLHVMEKQSGVVHSFDPEAKSWQGPYNVRPDQNIYSSVITTVNDGVMIMTGLVGEPENLKSVKLWEVKSALEFECRKVGEMPEEMIKKLKGESCGGCLCSIAVTAMDGWIYIHNPSEPNELVVTEIANGECRWWKSVRNVVVNYERRLGNIVVSCSNVSMADLQRAERSLGRRSFSVELKGLST